jgi:hypothetical protein
MPVDQLPTRRAPRPAADARLVQYDRYIDTQIQNTRRAVKAVDWATSLLELVIGVVLFLLTAAVVEHWIVPGGFSVAVRTILFVVLVGGVCYFAYRRLWPLCRRAINPVYAAQTIEQASPSLKNSIINLLLFRQHRAEISDAVYHTLEEQAAQGLTRVSVDSAVDRTALIRIGYVMLAVVSLAALYKVLSPKDPVVTAERVLLPWSDIVPASRVSISGVTPGTVTVSRGEFVEVSAEVRGIDDDDTVLLRYSSDDGQAVDKPIEMKLSNDGLRFAGRLPDAVPSAGRVGLAQNVRYRIEAGDARSLDYDVTVVPAPSIQVERIQYKYPDYTGYVAREVQGSGDIRAIDGTEVTIHARTNGPIKTAEVDFNADGSRDLSMMGREDTAQATFNLKLREDGQTPQYSSYMLRFTNVEGRFNRDPVKYPIVVEPDLAPEAAILRPQEKTLDVRLNDTVTIEVEARDPDFGLAKVQLRGKVPGRPEIDEPILTSKHTGRFTGRYQFTPSAHNLRAGDMLEYWVEARDNRTPTANIVESEHKQLRIGSPDPAKQPPPDRIAQRDQRQQPNQNERSQQQEQRRDQQQGGGEQRQEDNQPHDGESASADGQQQRGDGEQPPRDEQSNRDEVQNTEPGQSGQGGQEKGRQGDNQPRGGESASADGQQRGEGQPKSNDEQTGAGAAGGESSQKGSQPAGTRQPAQPDAGSARPDGNNTKNPANGQSDGGEQQQPDAEKAPVSSEGDNDAEAFNRIQRHMERKGELKDGESASPQDREQSSRDEGTTEPGLQNANAEQRQGEQEKAAQDRSEDAPAHSDAEKQNRDGESVSADGQKANERSEGSGAETKPGDMPDKGSEPRDSGEQPKSPGGQQTNTKGPSGAGNEQQSQGSPNAQPEMKPSDKRQQTGSEGEQTDQQEPPAGARGNKESDSQGEQGGDKAGGGEEGGGQKSPRDGTGSAGQNQSADEGGGESSEKGAGNNSPNAGQDATADDRTGQSGDETTGRGSKQRDDEGSKPGGAEQRQGEGEGKSPDGGEDAPANPEQGNGEPASRDAQPSANKKQGETSDPNQRGGAPTGDGGRTGTDGSASPSEGVVPEGDAANLEYARKQTDLVLDKLADQLKKKQVDKNLLEQLGWTEEELRRFVSRWQERKATAQRNDPTGESARRELNDALRSLGLRGGPLKQSTIKDDTQRDMRQGFRGPVPLEYQERLRAYSQGVSRARQDDE